jgi:hypothetical protein
MLVRQLRFRMEATRGAGSCISFGRGWAPVKDLCGGSSIHMLRKHYTNQVCEALKRAMGRTEGPTSTTWWFGVLICAYEGGDVRDEIA